MIIFTTRRSFNARPKSLIVTQIKLSSKLLLPRWTIHCFPDSFISPVWLLQKCKFGIHKKMLFKKLNLSHHSSNWSKRSRFSGHGAHSLCLSWPCATYILQCPQTPSRSPTCSLTCLKRQRRVQMGCAFGFHSRHLPAVPRMWCPCRVRWGMTLPFWNLRPPQRGSARPANLWAGRGK